MWWCFEGCVVGEHGGSGGGGGKRKEGRGAKLVKRV